MIICMCVQLLMIPVVYECVSIQSRARKDFSEIPRYGVDVQVSCKHHTSCCCGRSRAAIAGIFLRLIVKA